jgi:hypothetical protein
MTALVTEADGSVRLVDIDEPARPYLILSRWSGVRERGVWVHRWYRQEPALAMDHWPRYHYLETRTDQESPMDEQGHH